MVNEGDGAPAGESESMTWLAMTAALLRLAALGLLDPSLDDQSPVFEYFTATWARLPVYREQPRQRTAEQLLRLTPEGQLAGPHGRLVVLAGDPPRVVHGRVATWLEGWLPVALTADDRGPLPLRLQLTAANVDGLPGEVGLLRVLAEGGREATRLPLWVGLVPDAGLPVRWPEPELDLPWTFGDGYLARDERLLFGFPRLDGLLGHALVEQPSAGPFSLRELRALPTSPVGLVRYELAVPARRARALTFVLPAEAVAPSLAVPALRRVDFDTAVLRAKNEWEAWLAGRPRADVPEGKVRGAYRAAMLRLHSFAGGEQPLVLSAADEQRLLAAERERGLVMVALGPRYRALDPALSLRRARLHLAADQPAAALSLLYAALLHTTATHEFAPRVPAGWGPRRPLFDWGLPGDTAAASEYVALCRELLVREEGDTLRLFSAVSPAWLADGRALVAERIATRWGEVSTRLRVRDGVIAVELPTGLTGEPRMAVRVPWCATPRAIEVDGEPVAAEGGWILVTAAARSVTIAYDAASLGAGPSYASAVEAYRAEYRERALVYRESGGVYAAPPALELLDEAERRARFEQKYGTAD